MASPFTRRQFLVASAGLVALTACGTGDSKSGSGAPTSASDSPDDTLNVVLASFLTVTGREQRLAFGVLRGQEPIGVDLPVKAAIADQDEKGTLATVDAVRHSDGIEERPFFTVAHTFETAGFYRLGVSAAGKQSVASFEVVEVASTKVPVPGRPLPAVASATTADLRGIEVLCSRDPVCELHDVTLAQALEAKQPLAVMISTPALCQSAICGPVLDMLLAELPGFPKVKALHLEPFADRSGTKLAPQVAEFGLVNEPALFLAGADGVVRDWFDGPFDREELRAALGRLSD